MMRLPVLPRRSQVRALRLLAASLILTACSTSSSTQPTDDGGVLPDGGDSPDGGTPDGSTPDGAPVIESFSADPLGLPVNGGMVTLSWLVSGADTLSIDQGVGDVPGDTTMVEVTETTRFTLTATNDKGSVTRETSVFTSTGEPPPFPRSGVPTSADAIEAALENGTIDDVTALRYKVFALFRDPRLPAEFEAEGLVHGTPIMKELAVRFSALAPEIQEELRPFTLPPDDPESWYQRGPQLQRLGAKGGSNLWFSHKVANGALEVWWEETLPASEQALIREVLVPAIEATYNKLVGRLKMRPPISYVPGAPYDVRIIEKGSDDYGWTIFKAFDDGRGGRPSLVYIDLGTTGSAASDMTKATAAHELMHAMQGAYKTADDWGSETSTLHWLAESTATWAEHYVYPDFDTEHEYADDFFQDPKRSLDDTYGKHEYGAYLFFMFVEWQAQFDDVIPEIWADLELTDVLDAVDFNLDGELTSLWSKFAAHNWNKDAPRIGGPTYYEFYDGLSGEPNGVAWSLSVFEEEPNISGQQEVVEMDDLDVDYLSAQYYWYKLNDPSLHTIVFANGFTFELKEGSPEFVPSDVTLYATRLSDEERKGASVQLLVKANGEWFLDQFDITDVAFVPFCQDYTEERIEELVVIFSNGRWRDGDRDPIVPQGLSPRLFVSNFSCGDWVGSASSTKVDNSESRSETTVVNYENLMFTRARLSHESLLEGEGEIDLGGTIIPYDASPLSAFRYEPEIVDVAWEIDGSYTSGDDECIVIGEGMMTADDVFLSLLDVRPLLVAPTNDPGSVYRSFAANIILQAPGFPVLEDCSQTGPAMVPFMTEFAGANRNLDFGTLEISPDGVSINESWEIGDVTYQLDLLGISDP